MASPKAAAPLTALLVAVLLPAAMSDCSAQSRPSERAGRAAVEQEVTNRSGGYLRLVSFSKTNGQSQVTEGVRTYSMEYQAVAEFVREGCFAGAFAASQFRPHHDEFHQVIGNCCVIHLGPDCDEAHHTGAGARVTAEGRVEFEVTERGWRPTGVYVTKYAFRPVPVSGAAPEASPKPLARGEPAHGSDSAYVEAMKQDLRNLVTAQEGYFEKNVKYTSSLASLNYAASAGVIVTIGTASGTGWNATARHSSSAKVCSIFVGAETLPGYTEPDQGKPFCH